MRNKIWPHLALLIITLVVSTWILNNSYASNEQMYLKLDKGLFYLKQVYETVSRNYVDDVDPEGLSKSAIKGIVEELDPYTVFFEKKGSEHLDIITKGKYGGLGMEISKQEGNITVISPIDDTPAQRAGIRAGDVILKIDKESTKEMSLDEASTKLRGNVGTQVTIQIRRPGVSDPIKLTLTRQEIVIKDVSFANFIAPGTALFRLTSFSDKAASELKQSIHALQKEGEIKKVILDLRGNPGGLLASSVEVANIFIEKGELIVKTKGTHEREAEFLTTKNALLPDVPLIVLVDGGSASASEIVAGAVQDIDRGVIIGSKTFGKGLVQQVYPVDKINDAFLKITTAKYYVPSGRCIQKEDYQRNKKVFTDLADSSDFNNHETFYTKNGRAVYGGGGISPDITVQRKKTDQYVVALWAQGHFFKFTVDYLANHPEIKPSDGFSVTDEITEAFRQYLDEKEIDFEIEGEGELELFLDIAEEEGYQSNMLDLVNEALDKLDQEKLMEFDQNLSQIEESLELEFAEKLDGSKARIATMLKYDEGVEQALALFSSEEEFEKILLVNN
jgi:carboxyl-terminal processing protease